MVSFILCIDLSLPTFDAVFVELIMSIENLDLLSDEDLWEKMKRLKDGEEYDEECDTCRKPRILHV